MRANVALTMAPTKGFIDMLCKMAHTNGSGLISL